MPPLSAELSPLLTAEVTKTLARQGVRTVVDYAQSELVALSRATNLPYKQLTNIRQCLLAEFAPFPTSAANIWRYHGETAALLPTGCSNLDTLLGGGGGGGGQGGGGGGGGGILTGELTELTGVPSSGKTQLCHSLAGTVVQGTNSTVLWVDSSGGFSACRLLSSLTHLLNNHSSEEEVVGLLERVRVHKVFNYFDLLSLLQSTSRQISSQSDWFHANLHLLLVDSITPLLSPLLGGHGGHGHALLSHLAGHLHSIAYEHSIAVVYTNNTVADMARGGGGGGGGGVKPSLGLSWSYVPNTRVFLSLPYPPPHSHPPSSSTTSSSSSLRATTVSEEGGKGEERIATLTKSSRLAVGVSTSFIITERGLLNQH